MSDAPESPIDPEDSKARSSGHPVSSEDALEGLLGIDVYDLPRNPPSADQLAMAAPGDTIGQYRLLELIGEGGMGEVWKAEQRDPNRKVALKIIKAGMDTRAVVARFEAERQTLALMDHPRIAKVFDGGSTEFGKPFFVMEFVDGSPITDYCAEHRLTTRTRLELFRQVCEAIGHAHQKGIIHRDIKPSNVLVTQKESGPEVKVIDFGIARATEAERVERTFFTEEGQLIGTPAYMSPEQADLLNTDIDTRSDIYSLGVLLYELLTNSTPIDDKSIRKAAWEELCRKIREVDPPKPSARLGSLGERVARIATHHGTTPRNLDRTVRGELDWIVMRALEKDRERRYVSPGSFSDDIGRYLRGEAVEASPPSRVYRLQKFARRNKGAIAATTAVVLSLVIGLGVAIWMYSNEKRERTRAEEIERFLVDMLKSVGPKTALGRDTTLLREVLDETLERMKRELKGQPEVEARLLMTIGQVYADLGELDAAEEVFRRALDLLREKKSNRLKRAAAMSDLAVVLTGKGEFAEAGTLAREALEIRQKLLPPDDPDIARSHNARAGTLYGQEKWEEAKSELSEALRIWRSGSVTPSADFATALNNLASIRKLEEAYGESAALHREALEIRRNVLPDGHPFTISSIHNLASALMHLGQLAEADELYREAQAGWEKLYQGDHPNLASTLNNRANVNYYRGLLHEALPVQRAAAEMIERQLPEQHPAVATGRNNLARLRSVWGEQVEEALAALHQLAGLSESWRNAPVGPPLADALSPLRGEERVSAGGTWSRYDGDDPLPDDWRSASTVDGQWGEVAAPLRAEGSDGSSRHFRRVFRHAPSDSRYLLLIRIRRCKGALLTIDGTEIYRDSVIPPAQAGGDGWHVLAVEPDVLSEGPTHVLALDVPAGSGEAFDLSLRVMPAGHNADSLEGVREQIEAARNTEVNLVERCADLLAALATEDPVADDRTTAFWIARSQVQRFQKGNEAALKSLTKAKASLPDREDPTFAPLAREVLTRQVKLFELLRREGEAESAREEQKLLPTAPAR